MKKLLFDEIVYSIIKNTIENKYKKSKPQEIDVRKIDAKIISTLFDNNHFDILEESFSTILFNYSIEESFIPYIPNISSHSKNINNFLKNINRLEHEGTTKDIFTSLVSDKDIILKSNDKKSNVLIEYFIGHKINKLQKYTPNFVHTLGIFQCNQLAGNFCGGTKEDNINYYLILERITDSITLKNYLKNINDSNFNQCMDDIVKYLLQVILSLQIAQNELGFCHYDLHTNNILLKKLPKRIDIEYNINGKKYTVQNTDCVVKIIDFGYAKIIHNGMNISNKDDDNETEGFDNIITSTLYDFNKICFGILYVCVYELFKNNKDVNKTNNMLQKLSCIMKYCYHLSKDELGNDLFKILEYERLSKDRLKEQFVEMYGEEWYNKFILKKEDNYMILKMSLDYICKMSNFSLYNIEDKYKSPLELLLENNKEIEKFMKIEYSLEKFQVSNKINILEKYNKKLLENKLLNLTEDYNEKNIKKCLNIISDTTSYCKNNIIIETLENCVSSGIFKLYNKFFEEKLIELKNINKTNEIKYKKNDSELITKINEYRPFIVKNHDKINYIKGWNSENEEYTKNLNSQELKNIIDKFTEYYNLMKKLILYNHEETRTEKFCNEYFLISTLYNRIKFLETDRITFYFYDYTKRINKLIDNINSYTAKMSKNKDDDKKSKFSAIIEKNKNEIVPLIKEFKKFLTENNKQYIIGKYLK